MIGRMLERLREELDLAILTFFGGTGALVVAFFAVYRLLTDNLLGAVVDCVIAIGVAAIVVYAWRGTDVARAGAYFVAFSAVSCTASSLVFGGTATYWTFLVLSVNFVVTRPRPALLGSIALVLAIGLQPQLFDNRPEQVIFVVTAMLVAFFAWIFNIRYGLQQRQLERLALRDPLTGAGNRRALKQALTAAVARGERRGEPATLAVLDLDHFKTINDRYGHEIGDRTLVDFAAIVQERLRIRDGFFRFGGEEFVVVLPDTGAEAGRTVMDDLHRRVEGGLAALGMPVTVSIGVAALHAGDDWSVWLRRADTALYRAKAEGRNRVITAADAQG